MADRMKKAKAPPEKPVSPFRAWADQEDKAAITELCQHIITGGHLAGFVRDKGFAYVTVLDWIKADEHRAEMYARSREDRADVLADEIVSIADEVSVTTKTIGHGDESEVQVVMDATAIARNRLRVDARKWAASKLKPRYYGDKQQIELNDVTPRTQDQVDAELAKLVAKAANNGKR